MDYNLPSLSTLHLIPFFFRIFSVIETSNFYCHSSKLLLNYTLFPDLIIESVPNCLHVFAHH